MPFAGATGHEWADESARSNFLAFATCWKPQAPTRLLTKTFGKASPPQTEIYTHQRRKRPQPSRTTTSSAAATRLRPILPENPLLSFTMASLSTASRLCMRSAARPSVPAVRALSTTAMRPDSASSSYTSPFKGSAKANKIPDFSKYMAKGGEGKNKLFSYFMVGTMGALTAAGAKSTVQGG